MTKQRTYEQTHPWISFRMDLRKTSPDLWILLGQALARCEEISAAILTPNEIDKMNELYLMKGVQATTAIEGNTLTEEQIRARYKGRHTLPPSREYQGREVDNMIEAYRMIDEGIVETDSPKLRADLICEYNRLVLKGLEDRLEEGIVPGEIPKRPIGVGDVYLGAPRKDCMYLLERLCDWLEEDFHLSISIDDHSKKVARAILQGFMAHLYIAWIHPFGDGNGRTARLLEYMLLVRGGIPMLSAHLPSNHYNRTRDEYYRQLDRASKANPKRGEVSGFLRYALQGFVGSLQEQCREIREIQLGIAWDSFITDFFRRQKNSAAARRQREIALALSKSTEPALSRMEILNLNPEIARLYANKTDRTLSRDLHWLLQQGLIERRPDGYRARIERMHIFRPHRLNEDET